MPLFTQLPRGSLLQNWRTRAGASRAPHPYAKFTVLLPFYSLFDLCLSLLYLLFYLRAPPLYRFLCLVLYPLHLLVHLLLYLLLHSPTRGCTEHRSGSDPEENAESCSHPSPYLPVDRAYEGFSDAVRIRHEGLTYLGAYSRICGNVQKSQPAPYSLYCREEVFSETHLTRW